MKIVTFVKKGTVPDGYKKKQKRKTQPKFSDLAEKEREIFSTGNFANFKGI